MYEDERIEELENVLRSLACYLSVGGYQSETVDPAIYEKKIRDGIDMAIRDALRNAERLRTQDYK